MDLQAFLRILRRSWLLLAALSVLGTGAGVGYVLLTTPRYQSTAKVFVSAQQASSLTDLNQGGTFTQQVVKSYADVVTTPIVLDPVIENLELHTSSDQLAKEISANAPLDTAVLEISATDPSPATAAKIANETSRSLTKVVATLSPAAADLASPVKLTVIQAGDVPMRPTSPNVPVSILAGLLAGMVGAVLLAVARDRLSIHIRSAHDITAITDRALLASIPYDPQAASRPLIVQVEPTSMRAESFRSLRTNLQFLNYDGDVRSVVITSSIESEGKTTSAVNLALTMADAGTRTLIVDADLRRPRVAAYLGLENAVGLTELLVGSTSIEHAIQAWGDNGLHVLTSGAVPPNPSELLQSRRMVEVLERLRGEYEAIIFDAPPLLPVSDGAILARRVGGALVVCAIGRTSKGQLTGALRVLQQVDANILGLVMTMVPSKGPDAYGYGYGAYGYTYDAGEPTVRT